MYDEINPEDVNALSGKINHTCLQEYLVKVSFLLKMGTKKSEWKFFIFCRGSYFPFNLFSFILRAGSWMSIYLLHGPLPLIQHANPETS